MRLTRRGWIVSGVVLLGVGLALRDGPRAIGAVVVPLTVALIAATVQAYTAPTPTVARSHPGDGRVGEAGAVRLRFHGGAGRVARVRDRLPDGIEGEGDLGGVELDGTVTYRVRYAERGRWEVGPTTVAYRDVFGLVAATERVDTVDSVLVAPAAEPLGPAAAERLRATLLDPHSTERDEFDRLREYVPGDPLRDVDWSASARRPEGLVVTEYAGARPERTVTVAVGSDRAGGDDAARAAASLAVELLDEGVRVRVTTPERSATAEPGDPWPVLRLLAVSRPGDPPEGGDVIVHTRYGETWVEWGGTAASFAALCGAPAGRAAP